MMGRKEKNLGKALIAALGKDDAEKALELIEMGADVNARNENGWWTALHFAACYDMPEVAAALIAKGADVNARGKAHTDICRGGEGKEVQKKWTPLHLAASDGGADVVKVLLEAGADPDLKTSAGLTPADHAQLRGSDFGTLLVPHKWRAEKQLLKEMSKSAVFIDHAIIMKLIERSGAIGCVYDRQGMTAAHYAARGGHDDLLKAMIVAGVDVMRKTWDGRTVRDLALEGCGTEIAGIVTNEDALKAVKVSAAQPPPDKKDAQVSVEPEKAPHTEDETGRVWIKHDAVSVSLTETYSALARRITSVFNFQTGQCTIVTEKTDARQDAVCSVAIADMAPQIRNQAAQNFVTLGGDKQRVQSMLSSNRARMRVLPKGGTV